MRTLRRRAEAGQLQVVRSATGRMYVPEHALRNDIVDGSITQKVALYARESSSQNKSALQSQLAVLRAYAAANGWQVVHEVTEYASGMNDNRPKLHALLGAGNFDILLVENKDRLTRFGFRWFEALASFKIHVINTQANQVDDLMEDLVSVVTSFAARLYGQRRGRERSKQAIQALVNEDT